jgi:hypothetical protein
MFSEMVSIRVYCTNLMIIPYIKRYGKEIRAVMKGDYLE